MEAKKDSIETKTARPDNVFNLSELNKLVKNSDEEKTIKLKPKDSEELVVVDGALAMAEFGALKEFLESKKIDGQESFFLVKNVYRSELVKITEYYSNQLEKEKKNVDEFNREFLKGIKAVDLKGIEAVDLKKLVNAAYQLKAADLKNVLTKAIAEHISENIDDVEYVREYFVIKESD